MCGIGGLIKLKNTLSSEETKNLISSLLLELQIRGPLATGIAQIETNTDTTQILKKAVSARHFNKKHLKHFPIKQSADLYLLHTRLPSTGSLSNQNNHPLPSPDQKTLLIHNGCLTNYYKLEKEENIKRTNEVDSEIILQLYLKYQNFDFITKLVAPGTFCIYSNKKLYFYTTSGSLYFVYLPKQNVVLFASTQEILENVVSSYERVYFNFPIKNLITINLENYSYTQTPIEPKTYIYYSPKNTEKEPWNSEEWWIDNKVDSLQDNKYKLTYPTRNKNEEKSWWRW